MPRNEYVFVEHWIIPAPRHDVYAVLQDGRLLPEWWRGVYLEAEPIGSGEIRVGAQLRVKARGALPYRLRFVLESTRLEPDRVVQVKTHGDFEGVWTATLSDLDDGATRVDLDWRVTVKKPLVRYLSPLLRPLFAWNHRWTTPRGEAGLIQYLQEQRDLAANGASTPTLTTAIDASAG